MWVLVPFKFFFFFFFFFIREYSRKFAWKVIRGRDCMYLGTCRPTCTLPK